MKMTPETWFNTLKNAQKTIFLLDGKRKVHFLLQDGSEMVEEYDVETNVVIKRAWKTKNNFGTFIGWDVEIGHPEPPQNNLQTIGIQESSNNPIITKRLTKRSFEWRIRNLPYSKDVFSVTVEEDNTITVRTSNKKYYKKLRLPDLDRIGVKLEERNLSFMHQYNALIITYKKPPELINLENNILAMILQQKPVPTKDFLLTNSC